MSNFFTWQRNGDYEIHRTLVHGLPFPRKGSLVCFLSLEFGEDAMNTMLSPSLWLTLPLTLNPCWEGEELLTGGTTFWGSGLTLQSHFLLVSCPECGKEFTDKPSARAVAPGPEYPGAHIRICSHLIVG